jgi:CRISPR-associated protein Csd1
MILQALNDYYRRKAEAHSGALAPEGWIDRAVDFIVDITPDGTALAPVCLQAIEGKKRRPGPSRRLPNIGKQSLKHNNSGSDANLLWDNAAFALGLGDKAERKLTSFIETIERWIGNVQDEALVALLVFLRRLRDEDGLREHIRGTWPDAEVLATGQPVVAFRYSRDEVDLIFHRPAIRNAYETAFSGQTNGPRGVCLITGDEDVALQLSHLVIKGVWNTQSAGASIVSFNERAFESYGKTERQGENAPVSQSAAGAYTKALNHLLAKGSRQRMQVGDASTVFWAQKSEDADVEDVFAELFAGVDDPDARAQQIHALFESIHSGRFDGARGDNHFFVLGLAPNAARISVRFWHAAPLHEIAERIRAWFNDLEIARGPNDPEYPSLFRLLTAIAVQGKADNIPPNLGGDVMRSILAGTAFPATWLNAAVQRCRAEQRVIYLRAAAIKSCLNRQSRRQSTEKEFLPMLDPSNTNVAYRLGRLFAALEKIQEEANPGINATIRDRYYGAASSTPVSVFTTLLRLKNHHIAKLDNRGRAINFEKLIGEIVGSISDFPAHLALPDQGRFALGYYQQRQAFFSRPESTDDKQEAQ